MFLFLKIVDFIELLSIILYFLSLFLSEIDKINNFQQQKQHVLFLRNLTPKDLLC